MIEIITAIALLCQVQPAYGGTHRFDSMAEVFDFQNRCQRSYLACYKKTKSLDQCVNGIGID